MTTQEILLIVGMAFITFMIRYPMLVLVGRVQLPEGVINALKYVPVAVLVAICAPTIVMPSGSIWLDLRNPYLIGGLVTIAIAWRTQQLLLTIVVGMGTFLVWRALLG